MEVRQLRALLTMSRELIQADEPSAVLALTGRALADVAHIDSALLLVRGEVDETVSFDSREGCVRRHAVTIGIAWLLNDWIAALAMTP